MRPAREIEENEKSEDFIAKIAFRESFDRDARCVHLKLLRKIREQINECRTLISTETDEKQEREAVDRYVPLLKSVIEQKARPGIRPWVLTALTAVFVALMNPILASVGKFVAAKLGVGG
jgi:hypothetical protein